MKPDEKYSVLKQLFGNTVAQIYSNLYLVNPSKAHKFYKLALSGELEKIAYDIIFDGNVDKETRMVLLSLMEDKIEERIYNTLKHYAGLNWIKHDDEKLKIIARHYLRMYRKHGFSLGLYIYTLLGIINHVRRGKGLSKTIKSILRNMDDDDIESYKEVVFSLLRR